MVFFIGTIITVITIGLVLKYRALIAKQQVFPTQNTGCLSGCYANILLWFSLLGSFALIFGISYVANTYYDFLSLSLLMATLLMVLVFTIWGIFLAELVNPIPFIHYSNRKERLYYQFFFFGFMLTVALLLVAIFGFPSVVETYKGLLSGPQWRSGVVESKSTGFNRSGTTYYIDVNGEHSHVPDAGWWFSLEKGEEIQYAYNPHATAVPDIFEPNQIALTTPGAFLVTIGLLLWLLTVLLAWDGLVGFIGRGKVKKNAPLTEQKVSREDFPSTIDVDPLPQKSSKRSLPFLLLIGSGTVIFLAFRKLGQLRDNVDNVQNRG